MTTVWLQRSVERARQWRQPIVAIAGIGILAIALFVWVQFYRRVPPPAFASDEEHFLFGSIGNEKADGIPYWVWLVLPRVFPDHLPAPGGYAALGILSRPGGEMPAGFSKATVGYDRVALNCATCHVGSSRTHPDGPSTIVPGTAPRQEPAEAYLRFLIACASDPRFNASTLLAEIAKNHHLSIAERMAFRFAIIPAARRALLDLKDRRVLIDHAVLQEHADASSVQRARKYLQSLAR
jgi:hypothetical protein